MLNPAATAVPLQPGRRKAFIEETGQTTATSSATAPCPPAVPPGAPAAMCRGFVDAYGLPEAVGEAIHDFGARLVEVEPPQKSSRSQTADDKTSAS